MWDGAFVEITSSTDPSHRMANGQWPREHVSHMTPLQHAHACRLFDEPLCISSKTAIVLRDEPTSVDCKRFEHPSKTTRQEAFAHVLRCTYCLTIGSVVQLSDHSPITTNALCTNWLSQPAGPGRTALCPGSITSKVPKQTPNFDLSPTYVPVP